jgi:hypothetical protein
LIRLINFQLKIIRHWHWRKSAHIRSSGIADRQPSRHRANWCQNNPDYLAHNFAPIAPSDRKSQHGAMTGEMWAKIGLRNDMNPLQMVPRTIIVARFYR